MFGLGATELVLIIVLALIVFGPNKLPEVGSALGRTIKEFKQSAREVENEFKEEITKPINDTVAPEK